MATTTTRTTQPTLDAIEELYLDAPSWIAAQTETNVEALPEDDEKWADVQARERREKRAAKIRKQLEGPYAVAVYRDIARRSQNLTDAEYRVLDSLLSFGNQLKNSFPHRRTLLKMLGGPRRKVRRLAALLRSLKEKGWIMRTTFTEGDRVAEGEVLETANETGHFISAVGNQFKIPPDEIVPGDPGWQGPVSFRKRLYGQRQNKTR